MKNFIFKLFALSALFILLSGLATAQREKKVETLQHDYNFDYTVTQNDSCCFDITISMNSFAENGHEIHNFRVTANGFTYVEFSDKFTYPRADTITNNIEEFTICSSEDPFVLDIKIWCNGENLPIGHGVDSLLGSFDNNCDGQNRIGDGCCVEIIIDSTTPASYYL